MEHTVKSPITAKSLLSFILLLIAAAGVIAVSIDLLLSTALRILAIIGLLLGIIALLAGLLALRRYLSLAALFTAEKGKARVSVAPPPAAAPRVAAENEQAIVLLSLLQEKGRFVDFVMEEIVAYSNEQVGAAARVVHQGCRAVILDAFNPRPVAQQKENTAITLAAGFNAASYRLVGAVSGQPPYQGTLIHKGWQAQQVKLPRKSGGDADPNAPVIYPAEINL
jgi:hypothetical protein